MVNIHAIIISSLITFFHPFFVSVIDMKHNTKDNTIEITTRVFTDDLETTIKKNYNSSVDLTKSEKDPIVNSFIANYLQKKLQLSVNDKSKNIKYVGYEIQKESVWIYAEVNDVISINKINIHCSILHDYQDKQINIINVKANNAEKNFKLDYPKTNVAFEW